jgi:hypothetical protein
MMVPPSDNPEPWDMDPATAEAWRERERRQRSVRLLMMFLLMLLLMDGEEQSNRRRMDPHLRRKKYSRKSLLLEESVFRARRQQEKAVLALTRTHPRFLELLDLNGNVDYESQARKWADQVVQRDNDADVQPDGEGQEDEEKVFHYPWNVTGFYRGEWIRQENDDDQETDDTKDEDHDDLKEKPVHLLTPAELERPMLDILAAKDEQIGVFLLPEGLGVKVENFTASKSEMTAGETARQALHIRSSARSPFMRYSEFTAVVAEEEEDSSTYQLPLSKSTGRAAFQLYSRSVPSMKELSLVEGFVKLYDSNTVGYSTRRDILLRARGVLIHSIGRLSLVSNSAPGRSLLVLSDKPPIKKGRKSAKNTTKVTKAEKDDDAKAAQRRRLQEALKDVHGDSEAVILDQIRNDAMDLFPSDALEEHFEGWDTISSFSEVDDDMDLDLVEVAAIFSREERSSWLNELFDNLRSFGEEAWADMPARRMLGEALAIEPAAAEPNATLPEENATLPIIHHNATFADAPLNLTENTTVTMPSIDKRRMRVAEAENDDEEDPVAVANETPIQSSKIVYPFPYVRDDKSESIRKARTPASRRMPQREQLLEANSGPCEFEISLDLKEVEWTMGDWKRLMTRRVQEGRNTDPSLHKSEPDEAAEKEYDEDHKKAPHEKRKSEATEQNEVESALLKPLQDQALVMMMAGTITSPNCDFTATLNSTAIRTDWEHTTGKAINYSFYMMLTCLTQIVVLLRQLLHTQAQSAATRVSLLSIGWQTVLDALLCLAHVYLSLAMQPLFTAFASVAFFKLLIFCVIEMKYMAIIIQARNSTNGAQSSMEILRRQVAMLHVRFYVALVSAFVAFFYAGQKYRTLYVLLLYSFWVPQIIQNVITEAKKPLHNYYIYGMSLTRLVAPLYIFAVPNNFLKEVYPDSPTNVVMCELLVVWVGIQTAVLIAQGKYGARFMVPARFLPPKFDYNRPIPASLMPTDDVLESPAPPPNIAPKKAELPLLTTENSPDRTTVGTRNRTKKAKAKPETTSMTTESLTEDLPGPTLDCVICCNGINVHNRRGYMLAPCDHIFHRECLVQWMDVKMECPVCRKELPAI